jgi:hypothetical protein
MSLVNPFRIATFARIAVSSAVQGRAPRRITVASASASSNRVARAGQTVRLLDIPVDRGLGFGAFDRASEFAGAGKLADAVKSAAPSA